MPRKIPRPCREPMCPQTTIHKSGWCEKHKKENSWKIPTKNVAARNQRQALYKTRAWQKARKAYLIENGLCVECLKADMYRVATVVDHITDHKGDLSLFWDQDNWQSLCKHHHNVKTGRQSRDSSSS